MLFSCKLKNLRNFPSLQRNPGALFKGSVTEEERHDSFMRKRGTAIIIVFSVTGFLRAFSLEMWTYSSTLHYVIKSSPWGWENMKG